MSMFRRWWRRPDRFEWMTAYLAERRILTAARVAISGVVLSFALIAIAMLASPAGPRQPSARAVELLAAAIGVLWALRLLWRWPTRLASRIFVVTAAACIAACCLAQNDPITGLTGCFAFVVLGGYGALLHCAKATTVTVTVTLAVAGLLAWRVGVHGGDLVLAGCEMAILTVFVVGAPVSLNAMLHLMVADIVHSERDPLTGLLNRRGFDRHSRLLLDDNGGRDAYFVVTMIDLDDFKALNDRHGHPAGDQALREVAGALRDVADALNDRGGGCTVIARAGGEEFLLAQVHHGPRPVLAGEARRAVASSSHGLTASVGVAALPLAALDGHDRAMVVDRLVARADAAMYQAKAAGGDLVHHHGAPPPRPTTPTTRAANTPRRPSDTPPRATKTPRAATPPSKIA